MLEVAHLMVECLAMIMTYFRDHPFMGIGTFILIYPLIKLLGKVLKLMIKTN